MLTAGALVSTCVLATVAGTSGVPSGAAGATAPAAPITPLPSAFELASSVTAPPTLVPPATPFHPLDRPEPTFPPLRRPDRHVRLAISEVTLGLAGGMVWYYAHVKENEHDFDYTWSRETWKKKLVTFEAVRFDDNDFNTNAFSHPIAATGLYLIARGNRLGPIESFLLTVAASTFWEFLIEYREVASINDLIATPMGGFTIGEPMVQTSAFLLAGSPGVAGRTVAALLNPVDAFNDLFDYSYPYSGEPSDPYGIALAYPHTLEIDTGVGSASFPAGQARSELLLGARAEVDARPDLASPGVRHRFVGPGALSRILLGSAFADREAVELEIATKLSILGGLWRASDGPDELFVSSSRRLFYGLGSGFEYASRSRPTAPDDFLGVTKLLGPMLDYRFANPMYRLHLSADGFYDFALVSAEGLDAYVAENGVVALPSVVMNHRYYYAQGLSLSARAVLDIGRWELAGTLAEDDFWWIHGRERFPPGVAEPSAHDRRTAVLGHVAVRPVPGWPLKLTVAISRIVRDGSMGDVRSGTSELRASTLAGVQF